MRARAGAGMPGWAKVRAGMRAGVKVEGEGSVPLSSSSGAGVPRSTSRVR